MKQGLLVIQVDGNEETPMTVVADVNAARDYILSHEREIMMGDLENEEDEVAAFNKNLKEALDEREGAPFAGLDVQFGSGFGSWDYRLVQVDVVI